MTIGMGYRAYLSDWRQSCLRWTQGATSSGAAGAGAAGKSSHPTKAAMAELFGSDSDEDAAADAQQPAVLGESEAVAAAKKGFWTGQPTSSGGRPQSAGKTGGKLTVAPRLAAEASSRAVGDASASGMRAGTHPAEAGTSEAGGPSRPTKPVRSLSAALRQSSSVPEAVRAKLAAQVRAVLFHTYTFWGVSA